MTSYSEVEDYIQHYGVLGMKWGVRKDRRTGVPRGTPRAKGGKTQKEIERRKKALKNRRTISNADLEAKVKRLKMERELKQLTEEDISPGKTFAKNLMSDSGKKIASAAVVGALAYAGKYAIDRQFDRGDLARFVAPNPNRKK